MAGHFVMIPTMAAGHMNPMLDLAKALALRGSVVTFVTTPLNAKRLKSGFDQCTSNGLPIRFAVIPFPCSEGGLPIGCENMDSVPSGELMAKFMQTVSLLKEPLLDLLNQARPPRPSCFISGSFFGYGSWINEVANVFGAPTLVFDGAGIFSFVCCRMLIEHNTFPENLNEPFLLPRIPHSIFMTRNQIRPQLTSRQNDDEDGANLEKKKIDSKDIEYDGLVFNCINELEEEYVEIGKAVLIGKKIWTVGPLSSVKFSDHHSSPECDRGNKSDIDGKNCTDWLDTHMPGSVVYVCFGSLSKLAKAQLVEIGEGLENSSHPYIWAVRQSDEETDAWFTEFEKKSRGLMIKGWAPQLLILSHPSVGSFLTHCGWNSTMEGITAGVPMITWPLFSDQFFNEKLVVDILGIGVSVGIKQEQHPRSLSTHVIVRNPIITASVEKMMEGGEEGERRRAKAKEVAVMGKKAMEPGGSSDVNLGMLVNYGLQNIKFYKE